MAEYFKCDGFDRDGYPCSSERVKLIEGPKGPRGPRGSAGKNYTTAHLSAVNTGGTILEVSAHGTAVPLNRFLVSRGFTPGESFTSFTVEKAGTYFMTYDVRTVQAASLKSRIVKNGVPLPETVRACSGGNSCLFRLLDLHTKRGRRPCSSALLARYRRLPAKGIGRLSRRRSARIKKSPSF